MSILRAIKGDTRSSENSSYGVPCLFWRGGGAFRVRAKDFLQGSDDFSSRLQRSGYKGFPIY